MNEKPDGWLSAAIAWWVSKVSRHPWVVILVFIMVIGGSIHYTVNNLQVNTDTSNLLSEDLPFRQAYKQYESEFSHQINTFLVVIDGATAQQARNAAKKLAEQIAAKQDLIEEVYTPQLGDFFDRNALLYLEPAELGELTDRLSNLQPFLAKMNSDPSLRGLLSILGSAFEAVQDGEEIDLEPILRELKRSFEWTVNGRVYRVSWQDLMQGDSAGKEGKRQVIVVKPRLDFTRMQPAEPSIQTVRQLVKTLEITPENGLTARITGLLALEYEELQSVKKGGIQAAVLSLTMAVVALWFAFRSLRLVIATFLTLIAGLILTAGFAAFSVGQLNMITVAFGVLYIGLGVDFAIHLGLRYRELYQPQDGSTPALRGAAYDIGPSLLLCAITTAVGFFSFIPTDYLGVSELGIISGSGMFISLIVTLTLLPALLSVWPFHLTRRPARDLPKGAPLFLIHLPLRHPTSIRWFAVVTALAAAILLPWVNFDYDPLNLRDQKSESVRTFKDLMTDSKTPPRSITVIADDDTGDLLAKDLKQLEQVDRVISVDSFIPEEQDEKLAEIENLQIILGPGLETSIQQNKPAFDEQWQELTQFESALKAMLQSGHQPEWLEQAESVSRALEQLMEFLSVQPEMTRQQYLDDLEKGLMETFPESLNVLKTSLAAAPVGMDELPAGIRDRWISKNGLYRIEVYPEEDISDGAALRRFVEEVQSVADNATGPPVVALESGKAVVGAFQEAFIGAWLVISIVLISLLRKLSDATYVIIPLLWAGLITGASTVLLDIPFNFANIIALPLLLGIGVDNGIHVVHRMRSNKQTYAELLESSTARGIFYSAITTIVSFLSLSFSAHPGTASMGLILTVGVMLTLVGTLIVLPAMLAPSDNE